MEQTLGLTRSGGMETMNDPMLLNQVLLARVHVVASLEKINVGWWQQKDLMKANGKVN